MAGYVRGVDLGSGYGLNFGSPNYRVTPSGSYADGMGLSTFADELGIAEDGSFDVEGITGTNLQADGIERRAIDDANNEALNAMISGEAFIEKGKIAQANASRARKGSIFGTVVSAAAPLIASAIQMSDETTKNTITNIENSLQKLRELRPVSYYYNKEYSSEPERLHYGFIAQEFQQVMPDATYFDEALEKLCIDPVELIGLLVRAVQELDIKVKRLEAAKTLQTI